MKINQVESRVVKDGVTKKECKHKKVKKHYLVIGSIFLILIIFTIVYSVVSNNKTYAINTLDASYYECPTGTTIYDTDESENNNWVCYVNTGISGICPLDKQKQEGNFNDINGTCTISYNEDLTNLFNDVKGTDLESFYNLDAYYQSDDRVYVYNSSSDSVNESYDCNSRNFVNTPADDKSYYGYYNSACVCYGSSNNNSFCHVNKTNWLDATDNVGGVYRYYIPTEESMTCEVGEPIVIGTDDAKGDLYACSVQNATLKKRTVTLNFNFEDAGYDKSDVVKEFDVANNGNDNILIDRIGITDIIDLGYELDIDSTICTDTKGLVYNGEIFNDGFKVNGSALDESSRFLENITCEVEFKKKSYYTKVTISDESTGTGTITSSGKQPDKDDKFYVSHGGDISIDVVADSDSKYISTTCTSKNGIVNTHTSNGISTGANIYFENVNDNIECTVTIEKKKQYTVTASVVNGNGTVTPTNKDYYEGSSPTIDIKPNTGYTIDENKTTCSNGDGNYEIVNSSIVITQALKSDVDCDVYFKANDYFVDVTSNPSGGASDISIKYNDDNNDSTPNYNDKATVTVKPNDGYEYIGNTCGNLNSNIEAIKKSDGTYSFSFIVLGNKSCQVKFEQINYKVNANLIPGDYEGGSAVVKNNSLTYNSNTIITVTNPKGYVYDSNNTICTGDATINKATSPISVSDIKSNVNCDIAFKPEKYILNVTSNDDSYGSVDLDKDTVTINDTATVVAIPENGYEYIENTCGVPASKVEGTNNWMFTLSGITQNKSCQVIFGLKKYKVTASVNPVGSGKTTVTTESVELGGSSYVMGLPMEGYVYDADNTICTGDATVNKESSSIEINDIKSDINCSVAFKPGKYSLVVDIDEKDDPNSGTIDKNINGEVTKDDKIEVTVTPNTGYEYESNTCGANGNNIEAVKNETTGKWTFTISDVVSDKVCYVSFMKIFTVSASATNGKVDSLTGSFNNSDGTVSVYENRDAEIFIIPNQNYVYDSNDCGAIPNSDKSKLTLTNVNENKVCNISFKEKDKFTVSVTSSNIDYGTVTPDIQEVYSGNDAKITIDVTDGNEFLNITCNNSVVEDAILNGNELTIPNVLEDKVCVVNYKDVGEYTVVAASDNIEHGTVTPDTQTVPNGGSANIILVPNEAYEYLSNDCGAILTGTNKLTLDNITSNRRCIVSFKERSKHNISANPNDDNSGSLVVTDDTVYNGDDTAIIVVPNDGYSYLSNDCGAEYSDGILFLTNITEDKICNVVFANNLIDSIPDDIVNVQTGNKEWIIGIILAVGIAGMIFGYRKFKKV